MKTFTSFSCIVTESELKGRLHDRENWVRTRQKIGPDQTTFGEKPGRQFYAGPYAHRRLWPRVKLTASLQKWSGPDRFFDGTELSFSVVLTTLSIIERVLVFPYSVIGEQPIAFSARSLQLQK